MRNFAVGLMVILILGLSLPGVYADQFQLRPYIAVSGEYNDNIFFSPNSNDAVSDYILTLKPGVVLTDRTERLNARLSGQVAPYWYKDNSELDDVDQDYRGRIDYQFTPKFRGGADAFFIIDHRPDRDLLNTGLVQNSDRRDRYHLGGELGYSLTEITSAALDYNFNRDDWAKQANRQDVDYYSVNLGLNHNLSRWWQATTGQLTFGYGNVHRDTADSDSFVGSFGVHHRLSELFDIRLRAGARYIWSDFDVQVGNDPDTGEAIIRTEHNSGWGAVGAAILGYNGERTRSALLFSHDISAGSGRDTPTELTRLVGSVNYRILEKLRVGMRAGIYRNKANSGDFGTQEIDQYTYRIRPNISWDFYDNFRLTAAYRYTYVDNRVTDRYSNRNDIFLQVSYGLSLFDIFDLSDTELRQVVSGAVPPPEPD